MLHTSIPGTNGKLLLCWQSFSLEGKSGDEDTVQDEEELVMPSAAVATLQRKQVSADDGECAHYIIEAKVQWKPFWLATQQYPQNNWLGCNYRCISLHLLRRVKL